ncbi:MAG: hypothetical protein AAFY48_01935 [Bacteroidota bacterium]
MSLVATIPIALEDLSTEIAYQEYRQEWPLSKYHSQEDYPNY